MVPLRPTGVVGEASVWAARLVCARARLVCDLELVIGSLVCDPGRVIGSRNSSHIHGGSGGPLVLKPIFASAEGGALAQFLLRVGDMVPPPINSTLSFHILDLYLICIREVSLRTPGP